MTNLLFVWLQALRLVEFAYQRYYRLDCSGERGLCERHARSCERCPTALKPAVAMTQVLKDLCHPQVRPRDAAAGSAAASARVERHAPHSVLSLSVVS